jgi:hypothetical protein
VGQCTRNYQADLQGCIALAAGDSDSRCNSTNSPGFTGHDYSYVCSEGKQFVCCNSETDFLSNVQDLGQCQRNTTPRKPTRRPTRRPTHQPTNHPTEND